MKWIRAILGTAIVAAILAASTMTAGARRPNPNFRAHLAGDQEVPAVVSATSGTAKFHVDRTLTEMTFRLDIRNADGLLGVAGAHIHCAPEGVNGPVVAFLAQPVPGGLDGRVKISGTLTDADILNPACGENIEELVDAMRAGDAYVNVHSLANPPGEVRGQIFSLG